MRMQREEFRVVMQLQLQLNNKHASFSSMYTRILGTTCFNQFELNTIFFALQVWDLNIPGSKWWELIVRDLIDGTYLLCTELIQSEAQKLSTAFC